MHFTCNVINTDCPTFPGKNQWTLSRNHEKHLKLLQQQGLQCQGCIQKPAIPFEADQCPPDMLHLKKGIISKLVNQFVDWAIVQHREEALMCEIKKHKISFTCIVLFVCHFFKLLCKERLHRLN